VTAEGLAYPMLLGGFPSHVRHTLPKPRSDERGDHTALGTLDENP
jgi:hypothetical protein